MVNSMEANRMEKLQDGLLYMKLQKKLPAIMLCCAGTSKHIRSVPSFQEKEVGKYFLQYEKMATSLEWL